MKDLEEHLDGLGTRLYLLLNGCCPVVDDEFPPSKQGHQRVVIESPTGPKICELLPQKSKAALINVFRERKEAIDSFARMAGHSALIVDTQIDVTHDGQLCAL